MKKLLLALTVLVSATACNAETQSDFIYVDKETGKEVVAKRVIKKEVKTYYKGTVIDVGIEPQWKYGLRIVCVNGYQYYLEKNYGYFAPVIKNKVNGYGTFIPTCNPNDFKVEKR